MREDAAPFYFLVAAFVLFEAQPSARSTEWTANTRSVSYTLRAPPRGCARLTKHHLLGIILRLALRALGAVGTLTGDWAAQDEYAATTPVLGVGAGPRQRAVLGDRVAQLVAAIAPLEGHAAAANGILVRVVPAGLGKF